MLAGALGNALEWIDVSIAVCPRSKSRRLAVYIAYEAKFLKKSLNLRSTTIIQRQSSAPQINNIYIYARILSCFSASAAF